MNINLSETQKRLLTSVAIALLAIIAGLFGFELKPSAPAAPAGGTSGVESVQPGLTYRNLTVRDYFVNNGTEAVVGTETHAGTEAHSGAVTFIGAVTSTASNVSTAFQVLAPQTTIVVTEAAVFTPTGSYQPLSAVAAVTPTLSVIGFAAGTQLQLVNTGTNAIRILDGAQAALTGNLTLGISDTLRLVFSGTQWLEVSASDN